MARPPECSRRGGSVRATLLILTVVLSIVIIAAGNNSVDVPSRPIELLTPPSSSPASPTPAQLPSVSAGHTTKRKAGGDTSTPLSVERELDAARAAIRRAARRRRRDLGHGDGNVSTADSWFDAGVDSALLASVYRNPAAFHRSYREMERRFKVYACTRKASRRSCTPARARTSTPSRAASSSSWSSWRRRRKAGAVAASQPPPASGLWTRRAPTSSSCRSASPRWCGTRTGRAPTTRPRSSASSPTTSASSRPGTPSGTAPPAPTTSCSPATTGVLKASMGHPELHANGIRALCNANTSEGFRPGQDVSVPEINLYDGGMPRQLTAAPPPPASARPFLAFFAGGRHGYVRDQLLRHWKGRDMSTFPVFEHGEHDQGRLDYYSYMRRARFCLCPSGYEVASPRVVEAVHAGCVPVIVSDGYALPFADVLRWEAFSVAVPVADIPRLREVLEGIPAAEVERMMQGVRLVKRHFTVHQPPERLDVFHMILHSVWLRRLNFRLDQ